MMLPGLDWWQRLRHSRGFGVHSPFAYRFIREVICERYAFYAYDALDAAAGGWPGGVRAARLLLRVAVWADAPEVAVCGQGGAAEAARRILGLACPCAGILDMPTAGCGLTVVCSDASQEQTEGAFVAATAGGALYMPDRRAPQCAALLRRLGAMPCGHSYINGSGAAIFVGRTALPSQTFRVRF